MFDYNIGISEEKKTIKVKNQFGAGASVIFVMSPNNFTKELVTKLVYDAIPRGYPLTEKLKIALNRRIDSIFEEHISAVDHTPNYNKPLYHLHITVDPFLSKGDEKIRYDITKKYLGFVSYTPTLPLNQLDKVSLFLSLMQNVFDCFKPEYGWGCLYDEIHYKFKGDANKYIWGINYFGPEYVEKIGIEQFDKLVDIYKFEKRPWGGVILQLTENPFINVSNNKKKIIADFLQIEKL